MNLMFVINLMFQGMGAIFIGMIVILIAVIILKHILRNKEKI